MSNPECCKMLAISGVIEGWPPQISLYLGNATLAKANTESRIAIVSAVLKYFSSLQHRNTSRQEYIQLLLSHNSKSLFLIVLTSNDSFNHSRCSIHFLRMRKSSYMRNNSSFSLSSNFLKRSESKQS